MLSRPCAAMTGLLLAASAAALADDAVTAKDYPGIGRIENYVAEAYEVKKFEALEFHYRDQVARVEGRRVFASYQCFADATHECQSDLGVQREFETVLKDLGGEILVEDAANSDPNGHLIGRFGKDGQTVYLDLRPFNDGHGYDLTILEEQDFTSSMRGGGSTGTDLRESLKETGKAVLHINFDFDKAVLRSDSTPVIQQIVALLQADPAMKLEIDGHTDAIGSQVHNKSLSQQRADAVLAALTAAGVSGARLSSAGFGSSVPIADNATSAGRAQNRRVELIKK
jgi:OmpA-OmpF porin, OOP family